MTHPLFENIGIQSSGMRHLSAREAFECCEKGALLLDLRDPYEVEARQFLVPELIWISFSQLEENWQKIPRERALISADSVGIRSKKAVHFLQQKGFANVVNMSGGIYQWERDNMPMGFDPEAILHAPCACMIHQKKKAGQK